MLRSAFVLAFAMVLAGTALAAGLGDRCKVGSDVPAEYLCPSFPPSVCLNAIKYMYCSQPGRQCGWEGTNGYSIGATKIWKGQEYVCTMQGFQPAQSGSVPAPPQAGIGDECKVGNDVSSGYLCQSGVCLQSISKMYCSNFGRQCGWAGEGGYMLGETKSDIWGADYVCTPTGFQKLASSEEPSSTIELPGVTDLPATPMVRTLNRDEVDLLRSVYGSSINFSMVRITNTEGAADGAPWTTNTPPFYTVNVGVNCYVSFARNDCRGGDGLALLVHELAHVWQGQHGIPFMTNSAFHQGVAIFQGKDRNRAYDYRPGGQWRKYNAEQQAEIIEAWYRDDQPRALFPYIRDNVRPGRPHATTNFK